MKTRLKVEYYLGDLMKVVATQLEGLLDHDQLQTAEICSIVKTRIYSLKEKSIKSKKRPRATKRFIKGYHSGNDYCLTKSIKETNTKGRLDVISACYYQAAEYDGLTKSEFLSLCVCYVKEHFSDGEDIG